MPSSRASSQPRDQTPVSCTAGRFVSLGATREAHRARKELPEVHVFSWEEMLGNSIPVTLFKLPFSLLKGRASDGFPVYQEKIIRESIRKFPYCEATLLQQLVRSIAPVEIVRLFLTRLTPSIKPNYHILYNYRHVLLSII